MPMEQKERVTREGLVKPWSTLKCTGREYSLPVPRALISDFGSWGYSPAHQGNLKNSIDFYVPQGSPVLAAAPGRVVHVQDRFYESGVATFFWSRGNLVEIEHENGEYTHYEHLMHGGVFVKVGDEVSDGQMIGRVGMTGFADKPHLHFQVHTHLGPGNDDVITLRARLRQFPDVYILDLLRLSAKTD